MAKLEKTTGYKDRKALVREMAKSLKGTPYDTSQPIPFSFYLYVPDRKSATKCGKILKDDKCETEVEKSAANDGKWLCLCHATLALSDGTVSRLGDRLVQLAKEHGGEFDGWEVNPFKNAGALEDLMALLADFQNGKAMKAKNLKKVRKKT